MSILTVFTKQAPTLAGYSFDAVLEDTLDASVEWTSYPVENGVNVNDHRIIQPTKWTITGAISNNPLTTHLSDFLGGTLSNLSNNALVASVAGLSAGFLAGSSGTRSSAVLEQLLGLMVAGEPFDVDAGDIQLSNMVIARIGRTKDNSNEQGLIFVAQLQELITVERLVTLGQPAQSQLQNGDVSKSAVSSLVTRGEQSLKNVTASVGASVNSILDGIF